MAQRVRNVLQLNLSKYEEYFFTAGGALNLTKCFYYLVGFTWTGTDWRYSTNQEINVEPVQITPTTLDDTGTVTQIHWCEASDAQRTLGAFIAPDGSTTRQIDVLHGKLKDWQKCLRSLDTNNLRAKWLSFQTVFMRKVMYPLIGHSCCSADLITIQRPVDKEVLHLLGLNEHFPRAALHAPLKYGGMGCITIHGQHVIDKLILFVHHMREKGKMRETMLTSMGITQLECGSSRPFFDLPANIWSHLPTKTWITHIWQECQPNGIDVKFHHEDFWVPKPVRERDMCIMDVAVTMYDGEQLRRLNMCRIALKVTFLSDIASVDGQQILLGYYEGRDHITSGRRTRLNWPPMGPLPKSWWKLWKEFLLRWCGTALKIPVPLGRWFEDAEMLTQCCYFLHGRRLILQRQDSFYEFFPVNERARTSFLTQAHPFDDLDLLKEAKVVDITYKSNKIYVISQASQNIIPAPRAEKSRSLQDLYEALSPELQRTIGSVNWPDMNGLIDIVQSIQTGKALGVSDGSVRIKEARASQAWVIQAENGSEISGHGPVDGTIEERSIHRAELQGQTAIVLMLTLLAHYAGIIAGQIATFCDNQAVVKKMQHGWQIWRYKNTKGADSDLQAQLRQSLDELKRTSNIHYVSDWVKGHQDEKGTPVNFSREVMLNVKMDAETKTAYDLPAQRQTIQFVPVFKAESCAVYIGSQKITSNLHLNLMEKWHEDEAKDYLLKRHGITTDIFPMVSWNSMRYALSKLSPHRRATAIKTIHRHLPTQDKLFQQGRVTMSSICPRCIQTEETNRHIFCCTNPEALKQRKADWMELWKNLHKGRTATIIEQTWRYYLQPILGIPLGNSIIEGLTIAHGDVAVVLQLAVDEQTAIGWDKLLLGIGTLSWKTLQEMIDASNPRVPQRSATAWINESMRQLLKFSLRCWKHRNVMIHGSTRQEQQRIALQRARDRVKAIYADPPNLASHFRSIHEIPLEHRLKMSLQATEQWLSMIAHQIKVTRHNYAILLRQHKPMESHLRTMRKEARSQAKERMKSASPRKVQSRAVQAAVKAMREKLYAKRQTSSTVKKRSQRIQRLVKCQGNRQPQQSLQYSQPSMVSFLQPPITGLPILRHHPP